MPTRAPAKCESLLLLIVATANIALKVFLDWILPAVWMVAGVSGNAYIIRSEFRSLTTDLKEGFADLSRVLKEVDKDLKEMEKIPIEVRKGLKKREADPKELGAGIEKFEAGVNGLSTGTGTVTNTLEDSMPACVKDARAVENRNMALGLVRLSRAMYLRSKQEAEHTATQKDAEC